MNTVKMYFFQDVEAMSEEERIRKKLPEWRRAQLDVPENILPTILRIRNETSLIRITDMKKIIEILS